MENIGKYFLITGMVLLSVTILSFISCQSYEEKITKSKINLQEEFSVEIASIVSMNEFKSKIKQKIIAKNISGIDIPILIDDYVRKKFYHRTAYQKDCQNWVLAVLNFIAPQYLLNSSMRPNDIIQRDYAICNQQSIVFQDIIKDYNFEYGSVKISVPGFQHFASAVKIEDDWYFFDSNLEPKYDRKDSSILSRLISGDQEVFSSMYFRHLEGGISSVEALLPGMIVLGEINKFPAKMGVLAQDISLYISFYGWIFLLIIGICCLYIGKKTT
jgi:hypothetical protein